MAAGEGHSKAEKLMQRVDMRLTWENAYFLAFHPFAGDLVPFGDERCDLTGSVQIMDLPGPWEKGATASQAAQLALSSALGHRHHSSTLRTESN